jgi:phospholipase D3/4
MDWRSLTQVKELGIYIRNCSCIANDLSKIFSSYQFIAKESFKDFYKWPHNFYTKINEMNRLPVIFNQSIDGSIFFSSAPKKVNAFDRSDDLESLLNIMNNAKREINIQVMNYYPLMIYTEQKSYWGKLDYMLRSAVIR